MVKKKTLEGWTEDDDYKVNNVIVKQVEVDLMGWVKKK